MRIVVTGGSGFVGSALIRHLIAHTDHHVLNLDKLTYAATEGSVAGVACNDRYSFRRVDVCDRRLLTEVFAEYKPDVIAHLAAESHVDRSIDGPDDFIQTNVVGTFSILEAAREAQVSKLVHVSTDEVFGSLSATSAPFVETTAYKPRSPYSATKAAADHLVRAWGETYGLPVVITNCSNNYGPFHFPEKLIPLVTIRALAGEPLPVYGTGQNIRDWLFVEDHARALTTVIEHGKPGETYNIGGNQERSNLEVVQMVCDLVDELVRPKVTAAPRRDLIEFVDDRPGHDFRYAIDSSKIQRELGWTPSLTFEAGLRKTVTWFIQNEEWWRPLVEATRRRGLLDG